MKGLTKKLETYLMKGSGNGNNRLSLIVATILVVPLCYTTTELV